MSKTIGTSCYPLQNSHIITLSTQPRDSRRSTFFSDKKSTPGAPSCTPPTTLRQQPKQKILPTLSTPSKRTSLLHKKHRQPATTSDIEMFSLTSAIKFYYPPRTSSSLHLRSHHHASSFLASSDPSQSHQKYPLSHTNSTSWQQCEYIRHSTSHSSNCILHRTSSLDQYLHPLI